MRQSEIANSRRMSLWFALALLSSLPSGCSDTGSTLLDAASDGAHLCAADHDCDDGMFCNGVERCTPTSARADARGCVPSTTGACISGQTCDEAADGCTTMCSVALDADGDGVRARECGGTDCDDSDPARFPGNTEVCDAADVDEDCDPTTFGFRSADGDPFADSHCCNVSSTGVRTCGTDCDDARPDVNPETSEVCDGRDNDCDGAVDEGTMRSFWPDVDGDAYGNASATPVVACTPPVGGGVVENGGDCADTDPAVSPHATDVCNGIDDDCNGTIDDAASAEASCVRPSSTMMCASGACTVVSCSAGFDDCNAVGNDGCEADLTSIDTCGVCTVACGTGGTCASAACDSIAQISAGAGHTCVLRTNDRVVCWGANSAGQVGVGDGMRTDQPAPLVVAGLPEMPMGTLSAGALHTCVGESARRNLYCWGDNAHGQLGDGTTEGRDAPRGISVVTGSIFFDQLVLGQGAMSSTVTGTSQATITFPWVLFAWGQNGATHPIPPRTGDLVAPTRLFSGDYLGGAMLQAAVLTSSSNATTTCFWFNSNSDAFPVPYFPGMRVACFGSTSGITQWEGPDLAEAALGRDFGCARFAPGILSATGTRRVLCSGSNAVGQLGTGGAAGEIASLRDHVVDLSVGDQHACAVMDTGEVRCWGSNIRGQLGIGTVGGTRTTPVAVTGLPPARLVAAGENHTCAVTMADDVWCWGSDASGQLGRGAFGMPDGHPMRVVGL